MERAQNSELAKRINQAFFLLNKGKNASQIIQRLMKRYGVSHVQAYRYVQQAKENKMQISIPEASVVFTVKLTPTLINRVKRCAKSQRLTISKVVCTALEEFLAKKDHVKKEATS